MTCREKLKMEHPKKVNRNWHGGCYGCPHTYGYLPKPDYCSVSKITCNKCWNREIPESEPSIKGIKDIADHYGFGAQSNQLIEECAELIQAVNKYKRAITKCGQPLADYNSTAFLKNLVEEIADVEVMLEQIKYLLDINEEDIREIKKFKINRTIGKMENGRR